MLQTLLTRLHDWLFDPPESLIGKPLLPVLKLARYGYALIRDLTCGQLTLRAMSLVYTTLLSIAPLLALVFSVLKGLGYDRDLEPVLYQIMQPLGDKAAELTARIMGFVGNVREGVLGSLGLAFLIYNVISTVQKVEESFNFVWQVAKPRSWARRFSEYLSALVIGSVIVVAIKLLATTLANSGLVHSLGGFTPLAWLIHQANSLLPFLLFSVAFTFMYRFIPNTAVHFNAALCGGVFAGAAWTIGGFVFAHLVASSAQTALIYAGFAILMVALLWLYLSWLILLVGAQLAFYVQNPQSLRGGRDDVQLTAVLREQLALSVMYLVARDFVRSGPRHTLNALSQTLNVPARAMKPVADALENSGLLVGTDDERYLPGRDPATITLAEILDVVRNSAPHARVPKLRHVAAAQAIAHAANEALKHSVQDKTLGELVKD